jgi:hypothetical protein
LIKCGKTHGDSFVQQNIRGEAPRVVGLPLPYALRLWTNGNSFRWALRRCTLQIAAHILREEAQIGYDHCVACAQTPMVAQRRFPSVMIKNPWRLLLPS